MLPLYNAWIYVCICIPKMLRSESAGTGKRKWGKPFYLQFELFYLQLSFFADSALRCFLDTLYRCKHRSSILNQKRSNCKYKSPNCKQKSWAVSRKLPIASKKAASNCRAFPLGLWHDKRALCRIFSDHGDLPSAPKVYSPPKIKHRQIIHRVLKRISAVRRSSAVLKKMHTTRLSIRSSWTWLLILNRVGCRGAQKDQAPPSCGSGCYEFGDFGAQDSILRDTPKETRKQAEYGFREYFQIPSSVSFFALTDFGGESSVSSSQHIICVPWRTHQLFRRTDPVWPNTQWGSVRSLIRNSTLETVFPPFPSSAWHPEGNHLPPP